MDILDRSGGAMLGMAIGEALGAPFEGLTHEQIQERAGRVEGFVDPRRVQSPARAGYFQLAVYEDETQVALAAADDASRRHALRATLAGCDRATRLVEQLLTLARLEAGAAPALAPVDLAAIARNVAAELRNLVENGLRYSGRGAAVHVAVRNEGSGVRLSVEDSGPGMTAAEMARLGERFFRVPGSEQPGSGLGWSIVRRIAAVHEAEIDVRRSAALGGLAVAVTFEALTKGRKP
jgi:two-component system sensor histidine kinase QseC